MMYCKSDYERALAGETSLAWYRSVHKKNDLQVVHFTVKKRKCIYRIYYAHQHISYCENTNRQIDRQIYIERKKLRVQCTVMSTISQSSRKNIKYKEWNLHKTDKNKVKNTKHLNTQLS